MKYEKPDLTFVGSAETLVLGGHGSGESSALGSNITLAAAFTEFAE